LPPRGFAALLGRLMNLTGNVRSDLLAEVLLEELEAMDEGVLFYINRNAEASLEDIATSLFLAVRQHSKSDAEAAARLEAIIDRALERLGISNSVAGL